MIKIGCSWHQPPYDSLLYVEFRGSISFRPTHVILHRAPNPTCHGFSNHGKSCSLVSSSSFNIFACSSFTVQQELINIVKCLNHFNELAKPYNRFTHRTLENYRLVVVLSCSFFIPKHSKTTRNIYKLSLGSHTSSPQRRACGEGRRPAQTVNGNFRILKWRYCTI